MNLKTVKLPEAAVAILGSGLALGLALRLLEILRPAATVLGL
jgi:hypothetical protein